MITSNVKSVISKLEEAERKIPVKIKEAMNVDLKVRGVDGHSPADGLKKLAKSVMEGLAHDDKEREAIPIILNTFSAGGNNPMAFSMRGISIDNISRESADDFLRDVAIKEIRDWAEEYKIWTDEDERKFGKSPDKYQAMADHLAAIIKDDKGARDSFLATNKPGHGALNPTGLAYITGITGLKPERIDLFLRAVLASWVSYMRERMPLAIKAKLREAFE